jgi:hypothetical protein
LSLTEDAIVFVVVWLSTMHPFIGLLLVMVLIAVAVWLLVTFSRLVRRFWPFSTSSRSL